jgi:tetratricopeptide (TPR) repeat protein
MKLGKTDEAKGYFQKAENLDKNNGMVANNLGVAYALKGSYTEAETYLVKANKMGIQNNYNLGLIDLTKGDFKGALAKFGTTKCNYNVALAQVITGNNSAAASNLECARKNGATYYLHAIVGARTNNEVLMMTNLKKAIKANGKYRAQAAEDREFIKYFGNAEFQSIVK